MLFLGLFQYSVSVFTTLSIYCQLAEAYYPPSTCVTDKDCVDPSIGLKTPSDASNFKSSRIGDYICSHNKCQYVVAAGELCQAPEECASYNSYLRANMTPPADMCSSKYCTIQSTCDGAWTLPYAPYNINSGTCCNAVQLDQKCYLLSGEVNPCQDGSGCHIENSSSSQQRGVTEIGVCKDNNDKHSIWIGVVLVLLGGTTLNIGLNLQKYALRKSQERKKLTRQNSSGSLPNINANSSLIHRLAYSTSRVNPIWVVGFVIYIAASFLNFVALQFAPQSLVAPLGAISLVTNVIIAPIMNKEKLGKFDIIGVVVIIGGCVLVVVFSGVVVQDYRLCVLLNLFKQTSTIIYIVLIFFFIVLSFFYIKIMEKNITPEDVDTPMIIQPEQGQPYSNDNAPVPLSTVQDSLRNRDNTLSSYETPQTEGINSTLRVDNNDDRESSMESSDYHDSGSEHPIISDGPGVQNKPREFNSMKKRTPIQIYWDRLIHQYRRISFIPSLTKTIPRTSWPIRKVLPLCYAALGAMMATMTTLFAKSLINLLSVSIFQKENQFNRPLAWVILIVTVVTAFSQVYWINMGLQRYDAMLQVPVFYVIWTVFDIIGGGIYYNEFVDFSAFQYGMFTLGVLVIFAGVALLSKRMSKITQKDLEFENELSRNRLASSRN
ncbi:hypothetical protein K7432_003838 [Basidiobolus ranarum]|uniref:Magnesium transporter n=1 Tax=Basidiobolus ranarum TaxID=34480 RepID=A0ABR2W5L9_9FUNG